MFEKYITIKEKPRIICGQTSSGIWYCKELQADCTSELKQLVGETNKILNEFNGIKKKTSPQHPPPKEKNNVVHGLK